MSTIKCKLCEEAMDLSEVFTNKDGEVEFTLMFCEHCGATAKVYEFHPKEMAESWMDSIGQTFDLTKVQAEEFFDNKELFKQVADFMDMEAESCGHCSAPIHPYFDCEEPGKVMFYRGCSAECTPRKFIRDDDKFTSGLLNALENAGNGYDYLRLQMQMHLEGLNKMIHGCSVCNGEKTTWREADERRCCGQSFVTRPRNVEEMKDALLEKKAKANLLKAAEKLDWG